MVGLGVPGTYTFAFVDPLKYMLYWPKWRCIHLLLPWQHPSKLLKNKQNPSWTEKLPKNSLTKSLIFDGEKCHGRKYEQKSPYPVPFHDFFLYKRLAFHPLREFSPVVHHQLSHEKTPMLHSTMSNNDPYPNAPDLPAWIYIEFIIIFGIAAHLARTGYKNG